jgi:hypothetical protein
MVTEDPCGSVPGRTGRVSWVGLLVLLAAAGLGLWAFFRVFQGPPTTPAPRDPRRDYAGPFRNVNPSVRFVSEERCADCHPDIALAYAKHPMGRSLVPVTRAVSPPTGPRFHNPFQSHNSRFQVEGTAGRVRHRRTRLAPNGRPAAEQEWQVDYVLGSGSRGHSYLADRSGYLFQTPISWFSQQQVWDLSPGFVPVMLTGRTVLPECLFCHVNRANHLEGSVNRYRPPVFDGHAIGCQRCHGPGELHVASRESGQSVAGPVDHTIVNPRHLEPSLREAVCQQCHLTGEARILRHGRGQYDFRPGLPLQAFLSIFVPAPKTGEKPKAVSHVEQMYQSRCFRGSHGPKQLGCISCHDPHRRVAPEERVGHYRSACLKCHQKHGCSEPLPRRLRVSRQDSCIFCHMPRYASADIAHTASTDHRILRHANEVPRADARPAQGDGLPVISFFRGQKETQEEDERDQALALVQLALHQGNPAAQRALPRALPALAAAVRRDPEDHVAGEAYGHALGLLGRSAEALAAFQAVLERAADRELALVGAASMAEALAQERAALHYWRRAVAVNPWAVEYQRRLVLLLVKKAGWQEALRRCQAWVRLDPFSAEARSTRVRCLLATGQKEAARAEFARVEALAPPNLRELQIRFGKKLR